MILLNKPANDLLQQFCEGYETRNLSFLLSLFTSNATMWGSGLDEFRVGLNEIKEQLERDWSQSEKGKIEIINYIEPSNDAPWVAGLCKASIIVNGVEHQFDNLRGTLVAEKENNKWKISHMHCSFPDYRNAENESFPLS